MALILLQVLVLGVIAAAVDDVPVTWSPSPRSAVLACEVAEWPRVQARRPPPPLDDERPPWPVAAWRKGDREFSYKRVSENNNLEVRKNGGGDGIYQCKVRHHEGAVLGYPVNLKFSYMDKQFTSQPDDVTAKLGQPLVIPCSIGSGPPAVITWKKNGETLPDNPRYHQLAHELLITDVTREDAGVYKCIATNTNADKTKYSRPGRVEVQESAEEEPALLPVHHESQVARPRWSNLKLACPVTGWPRTKLIWELTPPGGRTGELESGEEVLQLLRLDDDQVGLYSCSVEGRSDIVKTFNVSYTEPVTIALPPVSKEAMRASTVRFNCTARGTPEPKITWYKDAELLQVAGRINLRTSADRTRIELVISGVTSDDAGVYQCFAWNGVSVASQWGELNVTGPGAAAPQSVRCAPAGAAAVALRWRPAAAQVIAYTVDFAPRDKPGTVRTAQPHTDTQETVRVPEPLTPYQFQVRAYIPLPTKKNVASDMSEGVVCMGQGVPIKLLKQDDGILVSWRQFAFSTPGVLQWILQLANDTSPSGHVTNVTLDGEVYNYTIQEPSTRQYVRVLGSRTLEWLPQNLSLVEWTSTDTAGQELDDWEATAIPYELEARDVSEHGFTLQWRCDAAPAAFLVCVRRSGGDDECQESHKPSATVEGLQPDSEYEVRVRVRAAAAASAPYRLRTAPAGPSRFEELRYEIVNASAVRVRWGGPRGNYTVRHSARLRLPVELWAALHTAGNSALINGIDPTEPTYVIVTGYSPYAHSPVLTIPAQGVELDSKDLQYEYTSAGVRVFWNSAGPREVRFAQNITQPLETWRAINVTDSSVELTDLDTKSAVYVMVSLPGVNKRKQVLNIPPNPNNNFGFHLASMYSGIGLGVCFCVMCVLAAIFVCVWRKRKLRNRTPVRARRPTTSPGNAEEEGSEMRGVAPRANGTEPLLNGHVHAHSKTPNGKMRKGRRADAFDAFDVSRYEPDTTAETTLGDAAPALRLLDTSRGPHLDVSRGPHIDVSRGPHLDASRGAELHVSRSSRELGDDSFNKLPDDNMNSELTRGAEFQLDNSKIRPTLQPNG
ncbi:protogenin A-like isoform X2 [Zerene cesonia]|uniref:protogenin A-like isoform X2 n=1 Tax=Zerene cesonia TaxID=33412 RepID=UPI0018E53E12|nr:protogenin A-like isoform X2 [Zerene cesonia]